MMLPDFFSVQLLIVFLLSAALKNNGVALSIRLVIAKDICAPTLSFTQAYNVQITYHNEV